MVKVGLWGLLTERTWSGRSPERFRVDL